MIFPALPVYDNDIFLKYRPFPQEPANYFQAHWHEIFGSFLIYEVIYCFSPILSNMIGGEAYHKLSKRTKVNFDIHIVSMIQCVLSVLVILPLFKHPNWTENSIFGYSPYAGFVASITCGYFIWDLIICLVHFKMFGLGFLLHAFAALFVFSSTLIPFCQPWIPAFLLFELSTPFVNINWFASRLPEGTIPHFVTVINGLLLMFTFFTVRILWGFYAVIKVGIDLWQVWDQLPLWLPVSILGLNLMLDFLNLFWFQKMVLIAKKKFSSQSSKSDVKKTD